MTKRVFIWVAHPKKGSFCEALAQAYADGAKEQGAEIRVMHLADMDFELRSEGYINPMPALEPDLVAWQKNIAWADHIFIIHPYWWGTMPASAKAVFDRALLPGFGYKYHSKGVSWDKLLKGKTADAIITSDTPPIIDTLIYRKPGRRVIKNQILGFCGIKARKVVQLGSVKMASAAKITGWLKRTKQMGMTAVK